MSFVSVMGSIYTWMGVSLIALLLMLLLIIFLVLIAKKTHAIIELKSWWKGWPISLFFQDNRYCEWKVVEPDCGLINDENYGAFIVNEKATYIDKKTKAVLLPFDANIAVGINIHAAKIADDLGYIAKNPDEMAKLRNAIMFDQVDDECETINVLKTTVYIGAIKNMLSAILPHNINSKIEKVIASRMKGYGQTNIQQAILLFVSIFGAICLGALVIYFAFRK